MRVKTWIGRVDGLEAEPITGDLTDFPSRAVPDMLSAAERRRSSNAARLAMLAAQEALRAGDLSGANIATVFASPDGDGDITR